MDCPIESFGLWQQRGLDECSSNVKSELTLLGFFFQTCDYSALKTTEFSRFHLILYSRLRHHCKWCHYYYIFSLFRRKTEVYTHFVSHMCDSTNPYVSCCAGVTGLTIVWWKIRVRKVCNLDPIQEQLVNVNPMYSIYQRFNWNMFCHVFFQWIKSHVFIEILKHTDTWMYSFNFDTVLFSLFSLFCHF